MSLASQLKIHLRQRFRERLRAIADFSKSEQALNQRLTEWLMQRRESQNDSSAPSTWAGFQPLPGEPNLQLSYEKTMSPQTPWAFPLVDGPGLRFFLAPESEQDWACGQWGQREPRVAASCEVAVDDLDGVLVPGLAFDQWGGRLGRGKGYYDQALKNYKGLKVGIAFKDQVSSEALPMESHDVRMDVVITEDCVLAVADDDGASESLQTEKLRAGRPFKEPSNGPSKDPSKDQGLASDSVQVGPTVASAQSERKRS